MTGELRRLAMLAEAPFIKVGAVGIEFVCNACCVWGISRRQWFIGIGIVPGVFGFP